MIQVLGRFNMKEQIT